MIKVDITRDMIKTAGGRAKKIPPSKNTFMPFERHVAGFVGEEMIIKTFNGFVGTTGSEVYNYDFLFGNKKIEVKTKLVTTEPNPSYECSTYAYFNQQTEYLIFNRIFNSDTSKKYSWQYGWILGWITYKRFHEIKTFIPKGEMQPNGFVTRAATWNILIGDLNPIETLQKELEKES